MASLFDEIQQRLRTQKAGQGAAVPTQSAQVTAEQVLRAKSGRAGPSGAPAASRVGEATAVAQAGQQAAQQQVAQTMAAEQLAAGKEAQDAEAGLAQARLDTARTQAAEARGARGAEAAGQRGAAAEIQADRLGSQERQQTAKVNAAFDRAVKDLESERGIARDELFSRFKQGKQELDFRKDAAELEQLAFKLQLADKQYVDTIKRIGDERRLGDELSFRKETSRLVFGEREQLLKDKYGFESIMDANDRKFEESMASMDIDLAMDIMNSAIKQKAQQQVASGLFSAASTANEKGVFDNLFAPGDTELEPGYEAGGTSTTQPTQKVGGPV